MFHSGIRPAVNVGLSVSRVGGAAQVKAMKKVAGTLRIDLAQFREMQAFAQFGSDLDDATLAQLRRGERLVEILKQDQYKPLPVEQQVISIMAVSGGFCDDLPIDQIGKFEKALHDHFAASHSGVSDKLRETGKFDDGLDDQIKEVIGNFVKQFKAGIDVSVEAGASAEAATDTPTESGTTTSARA